MSLGTADSVSARTNVEALLFEISAQRYALPLCDVTEVLRAVAIRSLPKAPAITLGIIDVRGEIIPVLDVRGRFALPPKPLDPSDHFLLGQAGPRRVALHVDRALGISMLAVVPLAAAGNLPGALEHVAGIAATESGLVLIHDLHAFLSQAEAEQLEAALPGAEQLAEPAAE